MEEKPKIIIDDDDLEILDFDDDIIDESPIIEEVSTEEIKFEPEIVEVPIIGEKTEIVEPIQIEDTNKFEISKNETLKPTAKEVENVSKVNPETSSNDPEVSEEQEQKIETFKTTNEIEINPIQNSFVDNTKQEEIFTDNKTIKEKTQVKKLKVKWKSILLGVLIFAVLLGAIIALPFMSDYVNKKAQSQNLSQKNNNENSTIQEFKSNIDVKKALEGIKQYKNYQYQNINTISTKDNTEQLISIKNNYIYSFNETKFEIYINKTVADFSYEIKDYYEKLDDVYNLYINDVTTKTYTKKNTTVEEFDKLINVFPNMINYLLNNYNVSEEKQIKVGNEEHINVTLKVPKDIINNMSVETDRIQNKIDSTKLEQDFVNVDLLFDKDEKLYKIEIEIEDKNASQEQLENNVESAILRYIFTDFNRTVDITLPNL